MLKMDNDPKVVLQKLMERYKSNRPKILRLIPYAHNGKQYDIGIIDYPVGYEACICFEGKIISSGYESDNIDGYMQFILEGDNAFLDELIQKAKNDIDTGKVK
jgi:hypothetical protein